MVAKTKSRTKKKGRPAGASARGKSPAPKRSYTRKAKSPEWQPLSATTHEVEWFIEHYRTH
jgi:hypothetical protein